VSRDPAASDPAVLAIAGGTPLRSIPFPGWPHYPQDEIDAVAGVLASARVNYWTGDQGSAFEAEFAAYCGVAHAIALANGTVALELALRVLGIGPGDEVIVPPKTFIATASAVVICGATPVFADIDPVSQCLDPAAIEPLIGARTRAVIAVHLGGWPADMEAICDTARRHGLAVIEDCAQAHGAALRGRRVGSFGDIAAFSFCQDKIMSTGGEGGMLLTDDEALWRAAWAFKDHGKSYRAIFETEPDPQAVFRWVHDSFGTNWRMTEMQAAIGRIQLGKLDSWLAQRRDNATLLEQRLQATPGLVVPGVPADVAHARYKFYAFVDTTRLAPGWDRDRILHAINAEGVPCFSGSCSEIYRERAFVDAGLTPPRPLPVAQRLSAVSLMFPCHPTLSPADMAQMADGIAKVMAVAAA
jgi:dTDP-4-amino-4,6-dideoxygalactose transaminase